MLFRERSGNTGSLCPASNLEEQKRHSPAIRNNRAKACIVRPDACPTCKITPPVKNPRNTHVWAILERLEKYRARIRSGTMVPAQVFHAGPVAKPAPQ